MIVVFFHCRLLPYLNGNASYNFIFFPDGGRIRCTEAELEQVDRHVDQQQNTGDRKIPLAAGECVP